MIKTYLKIKIKKYWLVSAVLFVALVGGVLFDNVTTVQGYTVYNNKFILQNSAGSEIFAIEDIGRMTGGGGGLLAGCDTNSGSLPAASKPGNWSAGWEVRNLDNNQIIFYVEQSGNNSIIHLDGSINQNQGNLNPGDSGNLIFQNKDGEIFAYINNNGSIYLKENARCP